VSKGYKDGPQLESLADGEATLPSISLKTHQFKPDKCVSSCVPGRSSGPRGTAGQARGSL